MKDERAKYLIIQGTEINKKLYKVNRTASLNDFYNIYEENGTISAKQIFEKYEVPEEFQKIIVKINIPFCLKNEAEAYMMGIPFDFTGGKIEKVNNKKIINVTSCPIYDYYANYNFKDKIKFRTEINYYTFNDIINFFIKLEYEGYLKLYLKSIKEFFDKSLNIDILLDSWNESQKNVNKALKLYKKKTLNRKKYNKLNR